METQMETERDPIHCPRELVINILLSAWMGLLTTGLNQRKKWVRRELTETWLKRRLEDKAQGLQWDTTEEKTSQENPKAVTAQEGGFTNSPVLARIHSWNTHVWSYWNAESFNKGKLWPSWISHTKFWRKSLEIRNFSRCEISQFERWQLSYLFFRGQIIKTFEDILNLLKKNSWEIKKYCTTRLNISSCGAARGQ